MNTNLTDEDAAIMQRASARVQFTYIMSDQRDAMVMRVATRTPLRGRAYPATRWIQHYRTGVPMRFPLAR